MDYEKAYKAVLKTATQWIKDGCSDKEKICLECVFPELRESEDERKVKGFIDTLRKVSCFAGNEYLGVEIADCIGWFIDWLEKQKEQKPVDFPTTDEEVKEFLETHPKVEVPEKYKTPDFVFTKQEYESHPIISKDTTSVKPAEWSEEDEEVMEDLYNFVISDFIQDHIHETRWKPWKTTLERNRQNRLKSIRPVSKESLQSWKPSEEQMDSLRDTIVQTKGYSYSVYLPELYEQLKKL